MAMPDFPIPPELAVDAEPLSDHDLARYFIDGPGDAETLDQAEFYTEDAVRSATVHAWRIEAHDQAEWALRKAAVATEELRQLREQAQEWAARIQGWFDNASHTHQRTLAYMTERLEDYGVRVREAGGPATLNFPTGSIKTSMAKPSAVVVDDAAVAEWIDQVPVGVLREVFGEDGTEWPEFKAPPTVKVYVGPFRKLVTIATVPGDNELTVVLGCDHSTTYTFLGDPEDVPTVGEIIECSQCQVDPIDGPPGQPVASAEVTRRAKHVVLGPDLQPVPGTDVKPGGIVPKVEVD